MTTDGPAEAALRLPEQRVVAALRGGRRLSRAGLADWTGLPRTTVVAAVAGLLRRGLLAEHDDVVAGPRAAGRPATVVSLAGPTGPVALVSLARTGTTVALGDHAGQVLAERPVDAGRQDDFDRVLPAIRATLDRSSAEAGVGAVSFVVLSVPLPFQRGRGARRIRRLMPDMLGTSDKLHPMPEWLLCDPSSAFSDALGVPVIAENDANLAALGEAHYGAGRGYQAVIYVAMRDGLGAGLVLDGKLFRGASGVAGELAHVSVRDDGRLCLCGGRGCLATVHRKGPLLVDEVEDAYGQPMTFADLQTLAAHGDIGVRRILGDLGRTAGRPLADLAVLLNPDAIVVDGSLGAAGEPVAAGIREVVDRRTPPMVSEAVTVLPGERGDTSQLLGAIDLAREHRVDDLLGRPAERASR